MAVGIGEESERQLVEMSCKFQVASFRFQVSGFKFQVSRSARAYPFCDFTYKQLPSVGSRT
jgi:hypothetical protein